MAVPESLPEKVRPASWGSQISWEKADPFGVSGNLSLPYNYFIICLEITPERGGNLNVLKSRLKLQALRRMGQDLLILMLCVTVFLSYLPEAGEYSCFFVYLKLVSMSFEFGENMEYFFKFHIIPDFTLVSKCIILNA